MRVMFKEESEDEEEDGIAYCGAGTDVLFSARVCV